VGPFGALIHQPHAYNKRGSTVLPNKSPILTKMATIRLFEQAMSVLSGMKDVPLNATATNPANPPLSLPTNLPSLITFIASFSALQDWLKLIVIGSVFEAIRRNSVSTFRYVVDSFWITAHFREDDSSYGPYFKFLVLSLSHA